MRNSSEAPSMAQARNILDPQRGVLFISCWILKDAGLFSCAVLVALARM